MTQDKPGQKERENKKHNQIINTLQEEGTIETPREWFHVKKSNVFEALEGHLGMDAFDTDFTEDDDFIYVIPQSWIDSNRKVKICKKTGEVMEVTGKDEL
jgi:hypothetical protein